MRCDRGCAARRIERRRRRLLQCRKARATGQRTIVERRGKERGRWRGRGGGGVELVVVVVEDQR